MAHLFLGVAAAWVAPPPPVTMYPNTSNVFGRAHAGQDVGVVRSLGTFNTTAACKAACLAYAGKDGASCNSFSFHDPTFRAPFNGACFAVADHSWIPTTSDSGPSITSGRVAWPRAPCGYTAAPGCEWQLDPVCLASGSALSAPVPLTLAAAATQCAADGGCMGFTYEGARAAAALVNVTFRNSSGGEVAGGGGCWAWRKYFPLENDPYRTTYHFQPSASWMNDPNGPMLWRGLYHLFWQWNPTALVGFANMHWGHAVSHDLLAWRQLPIALYPDSGACGGEWSGSATLNAPAAAAPVLSYSVQCNSYFGQATADDPADPLLLHWTAGRVVGHKAPATGGFRDPSAAWRGEDGAWRQLLACNGAACLYNSSDFTSWSYVGHAAGSGEGATWEMPDLFPLDPGSASGLGSAGAAGLSFFKVGMENGTDYYWVGRFDEARNTFVDTSGARVVAAVPTQRCDYGSFYSSKSFATAAGGRRLLIGWVAEAEGGPLKEWAGIQSTPRLVTADPTDRRRALFAPPPEIATLRDAASRVALGATRLPPSSSLPLSLRGLQLDLTATFSAHSAGSAFGLVRPQYPRAQCTSTDARARAHTMRHARAQCTRTCTHTAHKHTPGGLLRRSGRRWPRAPSRHRRPRLVQPHRGAPPRALPSGRGRARLPARAPRPLRRRGHAPHPTPS